MAFRLKACLWLSLRSVPAYSQNPAQKGAAKMMQASGTFDVKLTPQPVDGKYHDDVMGRMTIDKQFQGDLKAESKGQMLAAMTSTKGSAGYVAIERVTGTLNGFTGSFVLQHDGTMTRGAPQLSVKVVPDSGTDGFTGITGAMTIKIENSKHYYEFEYTIPPKTP